MTEKATQVENKKVSNIILDILNDPELIEVNALKRWNNKSTTSEETVPQHTFWVCIFARVIAEEMGLDEKSTLQVITYALFHDLDEIFSGDIVHPVKYNKINGEQIRELLGEFVRHEVSKKFNGGTRAEGMMINYINGDVPKHVKLIVKCSDWLSMMQFCQHEVSMSNTNFDELITYCNESIKYVAQNCIEACVDYQREKELEFDYNVLYNLL